MNELQKTEFEILKHTIQICEMLNLTYFLVCGSALGAAKYQGFIPWDDDVDIALPRKDYEVFCEKSQQLFPDYLFLQSYRTDKRFPAIYSKVRDSRTTYIEKSSAALPIHHGVYIDVFPLDGYPNNPHIQWKIEMEKKRYSYLTMCCYEGKCSWKARILVAIERLLGIHKHPERYAARLEKVISAYGTEMSQVWCNHGNWQGKLEYAPAWHYGVGKWASFEGLRVRIPENYDAYLTQKYGSWRDDLPPEQQVGHHYYVICDCNQPYTRYVELLPGGKQRVRRFSES